jgi:hypothetical protein
MFNFFKKFRFRKLSNPKNALNSKLFKFKNAHILKGSDLGNVQIAKYANFENNVQFNKVHILKYLNIKCS